MKHTKSKATLPQTALALAKVALEDFKKVAEDQDYEIDMMEWHRPEENGKCAVCLAGSVIAGTLQHPKDKGFLFSNLSGADRRALHWLNDLRFARSSLIGGSLFSHPRPKNSEQVDLFIVELEDIVRTLEQGGSVVVASNRCFAETAIQLC